MTSHLDDGTIHELLDGEIPSQSLPPIQSHLAHCPECRMRLDAAREMVAETDDLIEALDEPVAPTMPMVIRPQRVTTRPWVRRLAWAASVAIAVGAGYYGRGDSVSPRGDTAVVAAPGVAIEVGAARPTPVSAQQAPATTERVAAARPVVTAPSTTPTSRDNSQLAAGARRETIGETEPAARLAADALPKAAVPPSTVAAAAAPSGAAGAIGGVAASRERAARSDLVARDQVATKQLVEAARADTISFLDAVRLMGGTLRLIEGMVPSRLESIGSTVRVIYPVTQGELVLSQSVEAGVTTVRLTAPVGFPADSLARLRGKIKG